MRKTILITGASRGIGRAVALCLEDKNLNVVINYMKEDLMADEVVEILRKKGLNAVKFKADVGDFEQVKKMFNFIEDKFSHVDILINNAGIADINFAQDISVDNWKRIFDVNVHGMFYCTKLALKHMIFNKNGIIINLASIWGQIGGSMESSYSASKGAVIAYTKALAKEVGPSNIRVNAVAPGGIKTDMLSIIPNESIDAYAEEVPLGRIGEADEVANLINFLISDKANYISGQIIGINGGLC